MPPELAVLANEVATVALTTAGASLVLHRLRTAGALLALSGILFALPLLTTRLLGLAALTAFACGGYMLAGSRPARSRRRSAAEAGDTGRAADS
ncbi:MAG: hypothetical protein JKY37_01600 [Nannocystaceae bacterium]|nr:hypothetical protein [Nannocystaceae bacterium]